MKAISWIAIWGNPAVASQTDARLEALFASLSTASTTAEAAQIEQQIWQIWHEGSDNEANEWMEKGGRAMESGDASTALRAFARSAEIGIGVGLHPGYGVAQRLYVIRGYVPDGRAVTYQNRAIAEGQTVVMDDDLVLHLTKPR